MQPIQEGTIPLINIEYIDTDSSYPRKATVIEKYDQHTSGQLTRLYVDQGQKIYVTEKIGKGEVKGVALVQGEMGDPPKPDVPLSRRAKLKRMLNRGPDVAYPSTTFAQQEGGGKRKSKRKSSRKRKTYTKKRKSRSKKRKSRRR